MQFNIGARLLMVAIFIVLLVFSIFILFFDSHQSSEIENALVSTVSETGELATADIASWMSGRQLLTESLAQNLDPGAGTDEIMAKVSLPVLAKTFLFTYYGSSQGKMILFPYDDDLPDDYDPRTRPWYRDAAVAGESALTEPYADASTGKLIVTVTTPVIAEGELAGVVGGDLEITEIAEVVNAIDLGGIATAFLVNEAGTVLIHPDRNLVLKPFDQAFPGGQQARNMSLVEQIERNADTLFAFYPVEGLPSVKWKLGLAIDRDRAFASLQKFRQTALITTLIAVLAIFAALWVTIRLRITGPLLTMTDAMTRLASGDKDVHIPGTGQKDEIGTMAVAVQVFRDNAIEMERLAEENKLTEEKMKAGRRKALLEMANTFEGTVLSVVKAVGIAAESNQDIADQLSNNSEASLNRARSVSDAAEETTSSVQAVAAATEQLAASILEIGARANRSMQIAEDAVEGVNRTNETVSELAKAAHQIGEVVSLIQDIAGQTNLLALNATIEAARAGDVGKGFAVVASEVKTLATQTDRATGEIQEQVENIQKSSLRSVEDIGRINETIGQINEFTISIASAIEEQTAATQEISTSVQRAATGTREVSANVAGVSDAAMLITEEAHRLQESSGIMRSEANNLNAEVGRFLAMVRDSKETV